MLRTLHGPRSRVAVLAVLVLALAGAGANLRNGSAAIAVRSFSTSVSAPGAAAGADVSAQITIANSSSSTQALGSENVVLPVGYTASVAGATQTAPAGKTWSAITLGSLSLGDGAHQVLQFRPQTAADALAPGQSLTASVPVTVPCSLPADTTWKARAELSPTFGGSAGDDFVAQTGTYASFDSVNRLYSLAVATAGGSCGLRFVDPASSASPLPAWVPSASGYTAGVGFPVEVEATDSLGNRRTSFAGSAVMSGLGTSPNNDAPMYGAGDTGTHVVSFAGGLSSFSVTAVSAETGVALTATDAASSSIAATSASFDVAPGTPASLIVGSVANGVVGQAISPSITVDVFDAYGNKESCATCAQPAVSLSIAHDAGSGTVLSGGGPTSPVAGTATFAGVSLSQSGTGFTLRATTSSPALTSLPSNAFTIVDNQCTQTTSPSGYVTCSATKAGTSITTDYPTGTTDPTLFQLSAPAASLPCGSITTSIGSVVNWTPATMDTHGVVYTYKNPIRVTLRWAKSLVPGTGVANFTLCLAKPFNDTKNGWIANQYQVVQSCPSKLTATTKLPCASKRSRNNAGDLVIVLLMGSGDPIAGLG